MAEINLYQIQAIVSSNENTIDEIDIEQLLNDFNHIKTIEKAKAFLKENLNIVSETNNHFLKKGCFLSVNEDNKSLIIDISKDKKQISYCYRK